MCQVLYERSGHALPGKYYMRDQGTCSVVGHIDIYLLNRSYTIFSRCVVLGQLCITSMWHSHRIALYHLWLILVMDVCWNSLPITCWAEWWILVHEVILLVIPYSLLLSVRLGSLSCVGHSYRGSDGVS